MHTILQNAPSQYSNAYTPFARLNSTMQAVYQNSILPRLERNQSFECNASRDELILLFVQTARTGIARGAIQLIQPEPSIPISVRECRLCPNGVGRG
jgi:hypothetical protein